MFFDHHGNTCTGTIAQTHNTYATCIDWICFGHLQ